MNILITGGAGYIGSHVVLTAIGKGHEVTVFDDLSLGSVNNIHEDAEFIKGSTLSENDLISVMKNRSYDAIIHLAAFKAAGESMINPMKYAKNNIIGGINLINACEKFSVDKFIFSSTAAVYGMPKYNPINEDHILNPTSYYGYSKLIIENNLDWFSKLKGINYAALRYFNAAGYDTKKRIKGKEISPQNLIPLVMENTIGVKNRLDIYGNDYETDDGTGVRDYIHVSDLAEAHISSLEYIDNNNKNLIINLGTGNGYSVMDIVKKTEAISSIKIKTNITKRRFGDSDIVIANPDLAIKKIKWDPKYSDLETIIRSTWEIYKYGEN